MALNLSAFACGNSEKIEINDSKIFYAHSVYDTIKMKGYPFYKDLADRDYFSYSVSDSTGTKTHQISLEKMPPHSKYDAKVTITNLSTNEVKLYQGSFSQSRSGCDEIIEITENNDNN